MDLLTPDGFTGVNAEKDGNLRFRTKEQPRGLITRKHQIRLTLILVTLGLVLLASNIAGKADFWSQLFPDNHSAGTADSRQQVAHHTTLRPGPAADAPRILRDHLRDSIKDNVIGVSASETQAWFVSMGLAERLTKQQIKQAAKARYALLMDAPDTCRGQAWTITGKLRRLSREKLTNDSTEYKNVFDAWLTLPDSGDGLVHVVALRADRDLPVTGELDTNPPEVTVCGYFFKREAYASGANDGLSIAPLLLAGNISRVHSPVTIETRADQLTPWLGWLGGLTCGALGLVIWSFVSSDAVNRRRRTHELTRLPAAPSFEGVTIETPHETLHQLESAANELPCAEFELKPAATLNTASGVPPR